MPEPKIVAIGFGPNAWDKPVATPPAYLYECRECSHEFLLDAEAEPQCPKCKGFSVEPSERSE